MFSPSKEHTHYQADCYVILSGCSSSWYSFTSSTCYYLGSANICWIVSHHHPPSRWRRTRMELSFCINNNVHTVSTAFHGFLLSSAFYAIQILFKADDTKVSMVICKQQQMHTSRAELFHIFVGAATYRHSLNWCSLIACLHTICITAVKANWYLHYINTDMI